MRPARSLAIVVAALMGASAWGDLSGVTPVREGAKDALYRGDYKRLEEFYRDACARPGATFDDRLWLGHARGLAGDWPGAAGAYHAAFDAWKPDRGPENIDRGAGVKVGLLAARIELNELKDPARAARTLAAAVSRFDGVEMDAWAREQVGRALLTEMTRAQEALGDPRAELDAWKRLDAACRATTEPSRVGSYVNIERVAQLVERLGPAAPEFPSIFILTPEKPGAKLDLDDEATRRRSCAPAYSPGPFWGYAFAPPPGKEFATLEFACDIEQLRERWAGQFTCFAQVGGDAPGRFPIGSIGWPAGQPLGREVRRATFDIPPGVRLVRITTGSAKGGFNVYSVEVSATFRDAAGGAPPKPPEAGAWIQTEMLPAGGTLTCGERTLAPGSAYSNFKPGRYHIRYECLALPDAFEVDLDVKPGRRYGLFANLESPFQWTPAELAPASYHPPGRMSLAQLADGAWLAVWGGPDGAIQTARSRDLAAWDKPAPLPFNSVFSNIEPATGRDRDGTVWVAWFSKRLALPDESTAGYTLFLTSTRDGRSWTAPRPVAIPEVGGWPLNAPQLVLARDGTCRLFWRGYSASAASFADVRELRAMKVDKLPGRPLLWQSFVAQDEKGLFHVVFADSARGILHMTSADGAAWSGPREIVAKEEGVSTEDPQLVLSGGRAVLIWWAAGGAWAAPLRFDGPPLRARGGIKITNHVVPLGGGRLTVSKEGEVLLLAGEDTLWLLRAKLSDLMALHER